METASPEPVSDPSQLRLRLPEQLHAAVKASAALEGRSANAEVVYRLLQSYGDDTAMKPDAKSSTLTVRLSPEVREKLDALAVRGPYRISLTSIVERGIELAALELERLK